MTTIELAFKVKEPILACGADMKGAFAIARGREIFLEEGFGDLADPDNMSRYEKAVTRLKKKLGVTPKIIACDMHPGYRSTAYAGKAHEAYPRSKLVMVQHHQAHIASSVTDNAIKGDVLGVAFDGTGYGLDGNIWGGEFFMGRPAGMRRVGHLDYVPMPGLDAAVKEPWRMAAIYLYRAFGDGFLRLRSDFTKKIDRKKWLLLKKMAHMGINSPLTSSAGRLFDAVGSIVLSKYNASFEAELPIELEGEALELCRERYGFTSRYRDGMLIVDTVKTIRGVMRDVSQGIDVPTISSRFHNTAARIILEACGSLRNRYGVDKVVLSGGVFQNGYLLERATSLLRRGAFKVYGHVRFKTGDNGIPAGQVAMVDAGAICA